jgi:hypothetical protein
MTNVIGQLKLVGGRDARAASADREYAIRLEVKIAPPGAAVEWMHKPTALDEESKGPPVHLEHAGVHPEPHVPGIAGVSSLEVGEAT